MSVGGVLDTSNSSSSFIGDNEYFNFFISLGVLGSFISSFGGGMGSFISSFGGVLGSVISSFDGVLGSFISSFGGVLFFFNVFKYFLYVIPSL